MRLGGRCGGDEGPGLIPDERQARRVVEIALGVARRRLEEDPPGDLPRALRRLIGFARLSNTARGTVLRVLDEDEDLRAEVAASEAVDHLDHATQLWLRRPEGWDAELAALPERAGGGRSAEEEGDAAGGSRLARKLVGAERAAERERSRAEALSDELSQARDELDALRKELRSALGAAAENEARARELREGRARAVAELSGVKAALARRTAQLRTLEDQVAADAAALPAPPARPDDGAVSARLREVEALLERLTAGVAELRRELVPPDSAEPPVAAVRQPPRLPAGVLDGTIEAAEHLMARAGLLVLVDGYNVAKLGWPVLDLANQREALVNGLRSLIAGGGAEIWVVFDGAGVDVPRAPARPGEVQVRFSPPGVQADDEILELIDREPPIRPVAVVSNDRRVVDGARRRGARAVSSDHLLAVARR